MKTLLKKTGISLAILLGVTGSYTATFVAGSYLAKQDYLFQMQSEQLAYMQAGIDAKQLSLAKDASLLAELALHEAGGEPVEGQQAVMEVAINRLKTGRWGDSLRDVIYARKQFSYTAIDAVKLRQKEQLSSKQLAELRTLAEQVLKGEKDKTLSDKVLHFHAKSVSPKWAEGKAKAKLYKQIGAHVFYEF